MEAVRFEASGCMRTGVPLFAVWLSIAIVLSGCTVNGKSYSSNATSVSSVESARTDAGKSVTSVETTASLAIPTAPRGTKKMENRSFTKPADSELKTKLSALEYEVTQREATEPAFRNRYWDHHEDGIYVDVVTGEPLFSSRDKFDSGTGWPSFTKPIEPNRVVERVDRSYGMQRTEVRSRSGASHLGHVFEDGPAPTGRRYCINSASLRFIPKVRLIEEGYGEFSLGSDASGEKPKTSPVGENSCNTPKDGAVGCAATVELTYLAGGCFWGMQDILRKIPGVIETEVGYLGGTTDRPTYDDVKTGKTGHAETVKILFSTEKISFAKLLEDWFFRMHDPTTPNQQGNDRGSQYRSVIFHTTDAQRKTAEEIIKKVDASGKWSAPVVTQVSPAGEFTLAEDYHQDYLVKHPGGYTCHYLR